jgi:hypothetical protein
MPFAVFLQNLLPQIAILLSICISKLRGNDGLEILLVTSNLISFRIFGPNSNAGF